MAQTEKLNNNALSTVDEIKRFMGITGSTDEVDDELAALINRVSKAIETACDREFYIQEHTETYSGDGQEVLTTDHYPITTVSGVWLSTSRTWDDDSLVTASEYYINRASNGIVWYNNIFTKSRYENIRVIYIAGVFSTVDTVPADLKLVCIKEVARNYRFKDDKGLNSRGTGDGGAGGTDTMNFITNEFMPETQTVLDRYLRRRLY